MESHIRRRILPLALLCAGAFVVCFETTRRHCLGSSLLLGTALLEQAASLVEEGDDMGLIDWAKAKEAQGIPAFRLSSGSRNLAEGGNLSRLLRGIPEGASFKFPAQVGLRLLRSQDKLPLELSMVLKADPSPILMGLLGSVLLLLGWAGGLWAGWRSRVSEEGPRRTESISSDAALAPASTTASDAAHLVLDAGYRIQEITPAAIHLLDLSRRARVPSHLLDLSPAPALVRALARGGTSEVEEAFPAFPGLKVRLSPVVNGILVSFDREAPGGA